MNVTPTQARLLKQKLMTGWPREMTDDVIAQWIEDMDNSGDPDLFIAVVDRIRATDATGFPVTLGKVMELFRTGGNDAGALVSEISSLARRLGSYRHQEARDLMSAPAAHVVLALGGWREVCGLDADAQAQRIRREAAKLTAEQWRNRPVAVAAITEESVVLTPVDPQVPTDSLAAMRARLGKERSDANAQRHNPAVRVAGFKRVGDSASEALSRLRSAGEAAAAGAQEPAVQPS